MSKKDVNTYKRKNGHWMYPCIRSCDAESKVKYGYVCGSENQETVSKGFSRNQISPKKTLSNTIYSNLLDDWLSSSKLRTKESTYARYSHLVRTHIKPHLGKYVIAELNARTVELFVAQQLENGRLDQKGGLAVKTVTDILTIIKSSLEYARYNGIEVSCNLSKLTIKKQRKEMRVLTHNEQRRLVNVLMHDMDNSKFGVLLSLYTGIRIGELCALRWEDICLPQSELNIKKTMQRIQATESDPLNKTRIIITEPKSNSSVRNIPLPIFLTEIASRFFSDPQAFILSGDTNRYVEPRTMQNHFKTYAAESGIDRVTFHALRHTFATRCVEVGFEIKSLSEILGHANVNITLNRYVHSSFELKQSNMNKLELPL